MKTNNKESGLSYQYIPNVGKTIVTLNGCAYNFANIARNITENNCKNLMLFVTDESSLLKDTYRAHSKLNVKDGDVYNKEKGEQIAYEKVMAKYHKNLDSNLRAFLEEARNLEAGIEHYLDKRNIDYSSVPSIDMIKDKRFNANINKK